MKKYLLGLFCVVLCIALVGCGKAKVKDNKITIEYASGFPYEWQYEIQDPDIVEFDYDEVKESMDDGGPVVQTYYFKGIKNGSTTITFKYVSVNNGEVSDVIEYKVEVDKNLELTIKKK